MRRCIEGLSKEQSRRANCGSGLSMRNKTLYQKSQSSGSSETTLDYASTIDKTRPCFGRPSAGVSVVSSVKIHRDEKSKAD
jgi:hypothetical protein